VNTVDDLVQSPPVRIVLILLAAWIVTMVLRSVLRRALRRTFDIPGMDPSRAEARQRAAGAAIRSALVGTIWTIAVITVVSEMGVNIGAFVAAATIIGGAVAFGAQQVMRDILSGFFVLTEDQFGVGDDVDLGVVSGVVERVTLRSARIRDYTGLIWYVPHGSVTRVANVSKAVSAVIDLEVLRTMDRAVLDDVAASLCRALVEHPDVEGMLAGEPVVVGVIDVRDDRLIYRLRVAVHPGRYYAVRSCWRLLALAAFDDGRLHAPLPANVLRIRPDGPAPS